MTVWGIGPAVAASGVITAAIACFAGNELHCGYDFIPPYAAKASGSVLACLGFWLWLDAVIRLTKARRCGILAKTGAYAVVRHPVYAAFIVFVVPGLSLLFNNWLMLGASVVMFAVFKARINREEEFLENSFTSEYREYKKKVRQLIPYVF